jgi:Rieske Fe-S protein
VAARYTELVTGGDISSVDELPADSGAIIRRGLAKVAVYKDEQGSLREYSAICPHLGCVVHWNHVEKSWDCPCHGSRFSRFGEVLNGPAITDLKALSAPATTTGKHG